MMQSQVILVTGAARGIGRYIAGTFAKEGARLAVSDIESLDTVSIELREMGVEVLPVIADVRDEDQVSAMMRQVIDHFGRIDTLVNNAGIVTHFSWSPRWPRIRDMDLSFWNNILATNLGGTFLCTKHVLPHMEAQRSGHVINLYGGTDPQQMGTGACVYSVSKDAIRTFTGFVAEEERESNICVVAVAPGSAIATEEAPEEVRRTLPGPDFVGNGFVLASQLDMEHTGQLLQLKDDQLIVLP